MCMYMYIYMPCWTHILFVAQDSLEFTTFLPLPPECWLGLQGCATTPYSRVVLHVYVLLLVSWSLRGLMEHSCRMNISDASSHDQRSTETSFSFHPFPVAQKTDGGHLARR